MRVSGAALFSLGLALVAAYAVLAAWSWPLKAALFPLVMGIPLFIFACVQFALDLCSPAAPPAAGGRKALATFAWMSAFIALVLAAGFPFAVPVFVFSYLMVQSSAGALRSLILAAAAWAFFHLLFERLLHFPFEPGLLVEWLGSQR